MRCRQPIGIDGSKPSGAVDVEAGRQRLRSSERMIGGTIAAQLRWAAEQLADGASPLLDSELLLAHALGITRTELLTMGRETLDPDSADEFESLVARRVDGEPVAYLVGWSHFYDLTLEVTPGVLVPRPDTELLVEWAVERARERQGRITAIDVGTGTGALALALAANAPNVEVHATDIDPTAVALARKNARKLGLADQVRIWEADLLPLRPVLFDLVVANLPYVALDDPDLTADVRRHEPHMALFAGEDGLLTIRRLLLMLPMRLSPGADVGLEIGWRQGRAACRLAREAFPDARVSIRTDLAGHDRLIAVEAIT